MAELTLYRASRPLHAASRLLASHQRVQSRARDVGQRVMSNSILRSPLSIETSRAESPGCSLAGWNDGSAGVGSNQICGEENPRGGCAAVPGDARPPDSRAAVRRRVRTSPSWPPVGVSARPPWRAARWVAWWRLIWYVCIGARGVARRDRAEYHPIHERARTHTQERDGGQHGPRDLRRIRRAVGEKPGGSGAREARRAEGRKSPR